MYPSYPFGLEAEAVAAEQAVRLDRARHRALLSEARRAQVRRGGGPARRRLIASFLRQTAAGTLRAASAVLASLADVVERPPIGQGLERAG